MGSIEAACIAGFLCRLCSEMHRTVIHIYGDQGQSRGLAGKINAYLPVTIKPNDELPKTICKTCMKRVEQHHELMLRIQKHRNVFNSSAAVVQATNTTDGSNGSNGTNQTIEIIQTNGLDSSATEVAQTTNEVNEMSAAETAPPESTKRDDKVANNQLASC